MKNLLDIKEKLEELPAIRKRRKHHALFMTYAEKSEDAAQKIEKGCVGADAIVEVFPKGNPPSASIVKRTAKSANRLIGVIEADPAAIAISNTEEAFFRIFDNASKYQNDVTKVWENLVTDETQLWEQIAEVLLDLAGKEEGKELKKQARTLKSAIGALQQAGLPETKDSVESAKKNVSDLRDAVVALKLDTPFGNFLKDAASPQGAHLDSVKAEEVAKQIEELKLNRIFRIRI